METRNRPAEQKALMNGKVKATDATNFRRNNMTNQEEKIYHEFIVWLMKCSRRDYEDVHWRSFSTYECSTLLNAIMEDKL